MANYKTLNIENFKISIFRDYDSMSQRAAEIIAEQISSKKDSVIGFATGSTPEGTYRVLSDMYRAGNVDFSRVTAVNLDEYYPIKKSNNQSYDYFMKEKLFSHVNINAEKLNIPNGEAPDAKAECMAYEEKIKIAGGIDLQILGIGANGHIGFNEPGGDFVKNTHLVELDESTIEANARFFDNKDDVPKNALTMGIKTIMAAKKILLVANGANKAEAIRKMIFGEIDPMVQSSILALHTDVEILIDEAAAKELI